jgi:hypothetical protein
LFRQHVNPQFSSSSPKNLENWRQQTLQCYLVRSKSREARPTPSLLLPAPRLASPVAVMDARASRSACRDGPAHTVRWSSSAADEKRHTWLGYNGSLGFSSNRHERIPSHRFTAAGNQPSSRSEEQRSHSAPSSRSSSPGAQSNSRSWVPNFSRLLPSRTASLSTIMENRSAADSVESLRSRLRGCNVKRWDPTWRTTTPWERLKMVCFIF